MEDVTRQWQKDLVEEVVDSSSVVSFGDRLADSASVTLPQAQTAAKRLEPWMIGAAAGLLLIVILATVQPSLVQKHDKDRFYESKGLNWPLILVLGIAVGAFVTFAPEAWFVWWI